MSEIYRKSSIKKLTTLEQLDKVIVITSPATWLALAGSTIIIVAVTLWLFLGSISLTIPVNGIIIDRDGIHTLYSDISGTVENVCYQTGDYVHKGDVIIKFSTNDLEMKLDTLVQKKETLEHIGSQDDITIKMSIIDVEQEIKECQKQIENNEIKSNYDGIVSELSVVNGQVIAAGDYVARLSQANTKDDVVICYLPVADGRSIKVGMDVLIYPSTADRQEYGHMLGKVEYVDAYVTSRNAIINQVGVISLVDSFLENGPVVEVVISLERDENSKNGYCWSNKNGMDVELTSGTMVSADIITKNLSPISMMFPNLVNDYVEGD